MLTRQKMFLLSFSTTPYLIGLEFESPYILDTFKIFTSFLKLVEKRNIRYVICTHCFIHN